MNGQPFGAAHSVCGVMREAAIPPCCEQNTEAATAAPSVEMPEGLV